VRGNVNLDAARQATASSPLFGNDISKLWPISYEGQSDTACFDRPLEFLVRGGYSLPHAAMTLIRGLGGQPVMDEDRRAFLRISRRADGAWDGPAAIAFTDGRQIGPRSTQWPASARYMVTADDEVIMASEAGVLPIPESRISQEVAPAAGQDAAHRPRPGAHHLRCGDQGITGHPKPYKQWLARTQIVARGIAAGHHHRDPLRRVAARSPARPSATPRKTQAC